MSLSFRIFCIFLASFYFFSLTADPAPWFADLAGKYEGVFVPTLLGFRTIQLPANMEIIDEVRSITFLVKRKGKADFSQTFPLDMLTGAEENSEESLEFKTFNFSNELKEKKLLREVTVTWVYHLAFKQNKLVKFGAYKYYGSDFDAKVTLQLPAEGCVVENIVKKHKR